MLNVNKSIKAILAGLSREDLETLRAAFDGEVENAFIEYRPGRFVGVNITDALKSVRVERREGAWAEGEIYR